MKKIVAFILFTFPFLLSTPLCRAQDYYRQVPQNTSHYNTFRDSVRQKMFFFSFNLGVSIPVRDFGAKDTARDFMIPTNTDSTNAKGFSSVGFHLNVKGGVYLAPNFGLCARVGYYYNSFDANTLNTIINGYYYYTVNGNYNIWQFMGGAFGNFKLNPFSSVWMEGMLGDINANFPSFSVSNGSQTISGKFTNASDLAYSLSLGLEYTISDNLGFTATLAYTGAVLSYPTSQYTISGVGYITSTYTQIHPITMPYGTLDFTIGLIYHM